MKRLTLVQSTLIALPLALLTACGSDSDTTDKKDTAAAPATSSAAPAVTGDKELCEQANQAKVTMGTALASAASSAGEFDPAALKKVTATFAADLKKIAASGGADSEVAKYVEQLSAEFAKAAASADPEKVLDSGAVDKAGEGFDAACAKLGVKAS
ncbi:hypothetical protein [Paractinoplanes atraurantiacus]|uniref:Small secreted protein n=1 Tax=Paractinoplanes atraurantiacus TaxID=1036182 RepID=A0A285K060_9ACTN|nr:hypothetical protein [Actinoplanes atraurantiacus]SNY65955.1 hypothetical protein SAMN05421748_12922 [Actinoplanes atraurantiacus]